MNEFWKKSRAKRSLWKLGARTLEEVLNETRVLQTWSVTFGGSLVRNARFADYKSFLQGSPTRVSYKSVSQSVLQECSARVPRKSECHTRVSHKSDK